MGTGITLLRADITTLEADAIVNAANSHLAGGGGVDGAIHRAGGPSLMRELRDNFDGCPTGSAVVTTAGNLAAKYVIHAVGPRWRDGRHGEPDLLAAAYATAFRLAIEHDCDSVASPSISTGIYGFPVEEAAPIALHAAREALKDGLDRIVFALFSAGDRDVFQRALAALGP